MHNITICMIIIFKPVRLSVFTLFFVISLITVLGAVDGYAQDNIITNYQVCLGIVKKDITNFIMLRKFTKNKEEFLLIVDPFNLETKIIRKKECNSIETGFDKIEAKFSQTAYFRSLNESKDNAKNLQDAGITHSLPEEAGINLSIDLCPSTHPLNNKIFTTLINTFKNIEHPIPLAIAISGKWINEHPIDLQWLKHLQQKGDIDITWINHSLSHQFNKKLPLENNFMLMNTTNVKNEILGNEVLMIKNGLEPSVFFRFPGLISDIELLNIVYGFGLITIGSDAWLAKGNPVHKGSIVLIHGNGNEAIGVSKFFELLVSKKAEEKKKSWLLFDLRESLEEEFQQK